MRLWQAMLAGAKLGHQVFGTWSDGSGGTCAMGAVMLGCGYVISGHDWYEAFQGVRERFPELALHADCPVDEHCTAHGKVSPTLMEVIMHLNDRHHWSRQRIAEWLSGTKVTNYETFIQSKEALAVA